MVQVDIFWAYGLSSGLALAASNEIKNSNSPIIETKAFTWMLIWTALVFAPSGMYLLWAFPGWETMFVAQDHSSIPAWLVALFGFTNISQAILGFYVTAYFLRKNSMRAAWAQLVISYFCFFFVLSFGWDGTGYRRFFYAGNGADWVAKTEYPLTAFFTAPIFYTLLGMAVVFLPTYFGLIRYLAKSSRQALAGGSSEKSQLGKSL